MQFASKKKKKVSPFFTHYVDTLVLLKMYAKCLLSLIDQYEILH